MSKCRNPFRQNKVVAPDGQSATVNPDWLMFEGLTEKQKEQFLARRELGLAPAEKRALGERPLAQVYRDRKAHMNEMMRHVRSKTDDGALLVDFWLSVVQGENARFTEIDVSDALKASELLAQYGRWPKAAPVTEGGEAVPVQENNSLVLIGSDPDIRAAALALQRAMEARTGERSGQVVEGAVVARPAS